MSFGVFFRPAAEADSKEAYDWYEQREAGLGLNFLRCIDECAALIQRHPEMFPMVHKQVRQAFGSRIR